MRSGKKLDNHMAAIVLHFLHYDVAPPHKTLADPHPRIRRWPQVSPIRSGR
jgi:hypothetical protein